MKRLLLIVVMVAQASGVFAIRQYRDFTDTKGRTIRGCVVGYSGKTGVVHFERDNHRTSKVPITVFSEADQTYIREWEFRKYFLSKDKFKISAGRKKKKDKDDSYSGGTWSRKVENMGYEVVLENRAEVPMENLVVEYCIYYEQDEIKHHKQVTSEGVCCGSFPVESLRSKAKKRLLTQTVKIYKEELGGEYYYDADINNVQAGKVRGIWVRVKMKLPSGDTLTRDYCLPDSLDNSKAWMTSSVNVGMN